MTLDDRNSNKFSPNCTNSAPIYTQTPTKHSISFHSHHWSAPWQPSSACGAQHLPAQTRNRSAAMPYAASHFSASRAWPAIRPTPRSGHGARRRSRVGSPGGCPVHATLRSTARHGNTQLFLRKTSARTRQEAQDGGKAQPQEQPQPTGRCARDGGVRPGCEWRWPVGSGGVWRYGLISRRGLPGDGRSPPDPVRPPTAPRKPAPAPLARCLR